MNHSHLLTISNEKDLSLLQPIKQKQLQAGTRYEWFLDRTKNGYVKYLLANPTADVRDYQYEYAAVMCTRRNNFMGWQMRLGKSLASLLVIYGLYKEKLHCLRPRSIHIAVPSILASMSWVNEMERMEDFQSLFKVVKTSKDLETSAPIIIYSHDFAKAADKTKSKKGKKVYHSQTLAKLRPNLLIVDEVHSLKAKTLRTQHLLLVRKNCRRVLALSGTPAENGLKEIHHLMHFVYQDDWPYKSADSFSKQFAIKQKMTANYLQGTKYTEDGPEKFLQQLDVNKMPVYFNLMQRFLHRLNLSDPKVRNCITVPDTNAVMHCVQPTQQQTQQQQEYVKLHHSRLLRASMASTGRTTAEALQLINPLVRLANCYDDEGTSPKVQKVVDIVREASGKVVIFCQRVNSAWLVSQALRSELGPDKVIRLYGKDERETPTTLNQDQRIDLITAFQYDPAIKAGVLSISLASEAIELNKASDVIFYCLPWSSIQIRQAISRPVGPGNPHTLVNLHYLYHKGFIDEYQVLLATNKIKSSKMLYDYEVDVSNSDADLSPVEAIKQLLS